MQPICSFASRHRRMAGLSRRVQSCQRKNLNGSNRVREPSGDLISDIRREMDRLGAVGVVADKFWGERTQRSLDHLASVRNIRETGWQI
jgi:hypothetical protein